MSVPAGTMLPNQLVHACWSSRRKPAEGLGRSRAVAVSVAFVDHALVPTGTPAACLVDNVSGNAVTDRVVTSLRSSRGPFHARSRVAGSVHHDERPAPGRHRRLEVHVHVPMTICVTGPRCGSRRRASASARHRRRRCPGRRLQRLGQIAVLLRRKLHRSSARRRHRDDQKADVEFSKYRFASL